VFVVVKGGKEAFMSKRGSQRTGQNCGRYAKGIAEPRQNLGGWLPWAGPIIRV